MAEAFVYDHLRTPRGRGKATGSLHEVKPVDLAVGLLEAVKTRNPGLDEHRVDDVVLGVVTPVGDQGGNIAKTAALAAGYPETVAGVQLNRFCASGLEAVNQAASRVRGGFEDLILAGGVESMSRVPMASDGGAWAADPATALATGFVPQGIGADLIATLGGWSRLDVDTFAAESHHRAAKAWANGYFDRAVVPVRDLNGLVVLDRDETIRPDTSPESLVGLRSSFAQLGKDAGFDDVALEKYHWVETIDHVHHAGNSSGIVDGAALMLIGTEQVGDELGLTPRARIVSAAVSGADPTIMLTGPAPAARKALSTASTSPRRDGAPGRVIKTSPPTITAVSSTNVASGCAGSAGSTVTARPQDASASRYRACCSSASAGEGHPRSSRRRPCTRAASGSRTMAASRRAVVAPSARADVDGVPAVLSIPLRPRRARSRR